MTPFQAIILFFVALLAGALNSVAGGGSFFSFPTLIFTGVPAINANATNTIALWPGSVASVVAYRRQFSSQRPVLIVLSVASMAGGLLGALLLLRTPEATFLRILPWLLLLATALFAFGGNLVGRLRGRVGGSLPAGPSWLPLLGTGLVQLVIGAYGGFFGGGIGMMMLAVLSVQGMRSVHTMNALKTLLASLINGVAVVTFILAGAVYWAQGLLMVVGAVIGGYGGAHLAQRLDPGLVRRFVIIVGCAMTVYFFVRYY